MMNFGVAVCDSTAVGAQDAPDECLVLVVLDVPSRPFRCQPNLDTLRVRELVPPEYSIEWLTCAIADRLDAR